MAVDDFAGFGVGGFRSFSEPGVISRFGPLSKVHVVVGRNNVGKSNALHFAFDVLTALHGVRNTQIEPSSLFRGSLDLPDGWNSADPQMLSLAFRRTDKVLSRLRADDPSVARLLETRAFSRGGSDEIWIDLSYKDENLNLSYLQLDEAVAESPDLGILDGVIRPFSSTTYSDRNANARELLRGWEPWELLPEMAWVAAVRQITADGETSFANGTGLVKELGRLQSPDYDTLVRDRGMFRALTSFVQYVLDDPSAQIQVPDSKTTIHVEFDNGRVMPLENLGTGLGEVILLAAASSTRSSTLICIEEPEVHLHPTLQRKLLDYLVTETDNRYLISTHSAQFLDAAQASISHVEMHDGVSRVEPVLSPAKLAHAVTDLGNRPSDLVQSNFILWVEGPSDRIYVRAWLSVIAPDLVEGAHFTVMFYGGRLLSHLAADDDETTDFINLLSINRHLALLIDSDRSSDGAKLNDTKLRVIGELDLAESLAWVTEGYTIENYVPADVLGAAIKERYPKQKYVMPSGLFENPLGVPFDGTTSFPSKVGVARVAVQYMTDPTRWPSHLREQVDALANRIRVANGMPVS